MKYTLGVIGAGNMAGAILGGIAKNGLIPAGEVCFYDVSAQKQDEMSAKGYCYIQKPAELASRSRYILLSVKPQVIESVLDEIAGSVAAETVIISIAAGISAEFIRSKLGANAKVVRTMPNTPLMVGAGATALARDGAVSDDEFAFAEKIFSCAGISEEITQDQMNAIIAVNGSTPAYIYLFAQYFCDYAESQGVDADAANRLFCQTLVGAAAMMTGSGLTKKQLIDMVSSPGGTTLAGLQKLYDHDLKATVEDCCEATVRRAAEIGK